MKFYKLTGLICIILVLYSGTVFSRTTTFSENRKDFNSTFSTAELAYCIVAHRIGRMELAVNNNGTIGTGFAAGALQDCITGEIVASCEYPKNSNVSYLFAAAFWIGAVVGRDTLVSEGADGWSRNGNEFSPDISPFGDIIYRSIRFPEVTDLFENAVSEEDYIATYSDTFTDDVDPDYTGRPHIPLNIMVTQRSYGWSYPYAEDFILFDYEIKNIGFSTLRNTYMGVYNDGDVGFTSTTGSPIHLDDICGFLETIPTNFKGCDFTDTVNIAWIADNNGDLDAMTPNQPAPHVMATRIVRTPADTLDVSFNWWVSFGSAQLDFGPRERSGVGKWKENFRDFKTGGLGTPEGDANKYYMLRNREFDFDQIYTNSIQPTDQIWLTPRQETAGDIADGYDTRYLLSFGPFDISPGEKLPISFAYIAGENFHTDDNNLNNLPDDPDAFYANLNFDDLGLNSIWASRVYDNPGIDTDGDGYSGKFRVCCQDSTVVDTNINGQDTTLIFYTLCDTLFYEGDGVPDFRGASPPPAPVFWLEPSIGSIRVRFNGLLSETTKDVFSRIADFEGYRIYLGLDERESSFSMMGSFDIEDYNKLVWNPNKFPVPGYELLDIPFTLDSLRCLYGNGPNPCNDSLFDPLDYTRGAPYIHPLYPADSIFYFEAQDFNVSQAGVSTSIKKIYPNQPYPSNFDPDSANADEITDDGYLKYFEYEFYIRDILPTVQWWVNVTAFDFGSPESDLKSLETPKSSGAKSAYPLSSLNDVTANDLEVYVYPNPYRFDGGYRDAGYEGKIDIGRNLGSSDDRVRNIHFVNLPQKCTISIYSLDGDLIREIIHDKDPTDPAATHDYWDLITRNTQLIVSGIYYWTIVEDNGDTQIGKLVIIM